MFLNLANGLFAFSFLWLICRIICSVALGYDEGTVVVKIGREEPVASMDSGGKVIWARHNEIQTVNVRSAPDSDLEVC